MDPSDRDRKSVHPAPAIQPHGILLVLDSQSEQIRAAAGDLRTLLDCRGSAIGRNLADILGMSLTDLTRASGFKPGQEPLFLGSFSLATGTRELDILAHERNGLVLMELEPSLDHRPSAARLLARLRAAIARIRLQEALTDACRVAAAEVKAFTSHERVLVYRFCGEDGAGDIVAEDAPEALPLLMSRYVPEPDALQRSRHPEGQDLIRIIPDVGRRAEPLFPPETASLLDLSDCALRSASPGHVRYLTEMGVSASMSVSIMRDGKLWGLIACHSARPTLVPYELRETCKQISAALTQQLETIAARAEAAEAERLSSRRAELLAHFAASDSVEAEVVRRAEEIREMIPCDGLVISHNGSIANWGSTPSADACPALVQWCRRKDATPPYSTACLAQDYPAVAEFAGQASGVLAITANQEDPMEILWFRREAGHAGGASDPSHKSSSGRARPWSPAEVEAAQRLREGIERIKERQRLTSLQSSLIHMSRVNAMGAMASSIAHELNQPLTAVASYTRAAVKLLRMGRLDEELAGILASASDQSLRAGEIIRRLRQLVAPVEATIGPCSLASIIDEACAIGLIDARRMAVEVSVSYDREMEVLADKIQAQQVLLNLIRNALEALAATEERRLSVRAEPFQGRFVKISVADSGPGITDEVKNRLFSAFNSSKDGGLGIGLSICRTIVEAHGGKIWAEEGLDKGACFSFLLQVTTPAARSTPP